ncbi:MAG: hypothetical protein F6K65_34595 [Moorea sp. SIO3C2]|nr:hypothetical protein [Moorena sp. SIO3C2]
MWGTSQQVALAQGRKIHENIIIKAMQHYGTRAQPCLWPLAFPSWEGLGVGSSCLLPLASCHPSHPPDSLSNHLFVTSGC